MDSKKYFEEVSQKINNMSDEEFIYLIDSTIEQTELIGGLTTNIRWDILTQCFNQQELQEKYCNYIDNQIWDSCTFTKPLTPNDQYIGYQIDEDGKLHIINKTYQFEEDLKDDPLSPARGIINGLLISIPIWIIVGLIVWWVMIR